VIVVSGGAGFVGSHAVEHFSSLEEKVRVLDNRSRAELLGGAQQTQELSNWEWVQTLPGVEVVEASILDPDGLPDLVRGATAIIHAAAQTAVTVSVEDPRTDFLVNAVGTFNLLEAVRTAAPDAGFVFCSTNKVYGDNVNAIPVRAERTRYVLDDRYREGIPENLSIDLVEHSPYGASKTSADLYVQEYGHLYGLRTCVFRMSCIYGPRQWGVSDQGWVAWFAKAILDGLPITIYGDGRQVRDLLYVSDLIAAFDAALRGDLRGAVFNIGGGPRYTLSLLEAIELLEQFTGKAARLDHADWRPSDQRVYVSDIRKVAAELDWRPSVSPREGIERMLAWLTSP
jgi:CDP-paratose 2-epimerase